MLKDKGKDWMTRVTPTSDRRLSLKKSRGAWYLQIEVGKGGDALCLTGEAETLRKAMAALTVRAKRRTPLQLQRWRPPKSLFAVVRPPHWCMI